MAGSMSKRVWPEKSGFPVAVPGIKFIIAASVLTGLLFFMGWSVPGWFAFMITLFVCWFFRDPDRRIPDEPGALVSPADGRIIIVEQKESNEFTHGTSMKISIFMNVFNVHVNRIPFSGVVEKALYVPGKFVNASFDKASEHNERNALVIKTESGQSYGVVQIAGLIARRIVCGVKEGDTMVRGNRYGMICFGSRLDLYLPLETKITVSVGDKVQAGSTVLGYLK